MTPFATSLFATMLDSQEALVPVRLITVWPDGRSRLDAFSIPAMRLPEARRRAMILAQRLGATATLLTC